MSNMTVNQRNQIENSVWSGSQERIRRGSERGAAIYSVAAAIVGAALCYAAALLLVGWWQWLVLAVLVSFTMAIAFAVSPTRRGY
jgi:fatty acid desaturase